MGQIVKLCSEVSCTLYIGTHGKPSESFTCLDFMRQTFRLADLQLTIGRSHPFGPVSGEGLESDGLEYFT